MTLNRDGTPRKRPDPKYLYSVYRTENDELILLDATAEQCAKRIGVTRNYIYRLICDGGVGTIWTIVKNSVEEVWAEENEVIAEERNETGYGKQESLESRESTAGRTGRDRPVQALRNYAGT